MEMDLEQKLSVLSKKQRTAYILREQGLTYREAAKIMGISSNAVRQHIYNAGRRLREYEQFHAVKTNNELPVEFPMTRGELKIIVMGLRYIHQKLSHVAPSRINTDWLGLLPYEHQLAEQVLNRAESALYENPLYNGFLERESIETQLNDKTTPAQVLEVLRQLRDYDIEENP